MDYIQQRRYELLSHMTNSEKRVSEFLKSKGIYHILQYPIKTPQKLFFADVYIPSLRLILEMDGGYHYRAEQKRKDSNRSACMRRLGFSIYRLPNKNTMSEDKIFSRLMARIRAMKR